jgi:hypothetical protein
MDWFTILLLLIFFVFPLIQHLLEGRRRKSSGPGDETGAEEDLGQEDWAPLERMPEESSSRRAAGVRAKPESRAGGTREPQEWSAGWGTWPAPSAEPQTTSRVPTAPETRGHEGPVARPEPARVPREEAPGARVPVIAVQKKAVTPRHARTRPRAATADQRRGVALEPLLRLGSRDELRRAIVLNEVLGSPMALRGTRDEQTSRD